MAARDHFNFFQYTRYSISEIYFLGRDQMRNQTALANIQKVELFIHDLVRKDRGPYKSSISTIEEIEAACTRILDDIAQYRSTQTETLNTSADVPDEQSRSDSKMIVSGYAKALKSLAENNTFTPAISEFTKIMWRWYDTRILKNNEYKKYGRSFMFKPGNIRIWIYALVIYYGWCVEHECLTTFKETMDKFISDIGKDEKTTCFYPLPYIPAQIFRHQGNQYANLTAVYLWDMLFDNGLVSMSDAEKYKRASVGASSVSSLVESMSPGILDAYENYSPML